MKKEKENDLKTGSRSPLLPGHLEEKSYRSALEFDKYTGMGDASDSRIPVWGMEWLPPYHRWFQPGTGKSGLCFTSD
jgi:hypothetical protein